MFKIRLWHKEILLTGLNENPKHISTTYHLVLHITWQYMLHGTKLHILLKVKWYYMYFDIMTHCQIEGQSQQLINLDSEFFSLILIIHIVIQITVCNVHCQVYPIWTKFACILKVDHKFPFFLLKNAILQYTIAGFLRGLLSKFLYD